MGEPEPSLHKVQVSNYKASKPPRLYLHGQGYMPALRPLTERLTAGVMNLALPALTAFLPDQAIKPSLIAFAAVMQELNFLAALAAPPWPKSKEKSTLQGP